MGKAVWDAISTTYFDVIYTSQAYDLKKNVMRLKQVWRINMLQQIFNVHGEIDFCSRNPMKCEVDIQRYNCILQEDRI